MTREEKRRRRHENLLLALCLGIIAVWVAALILSCNVHAAYEAAETVEEIDPLTEVLAAIGALWVSWFLVCVIERLDTPRDKKK